VTAGEILVMVREKGLRIRSDGERLIVAPADELPDDLRTLLLERKPEILSLLRVSPPDGTLWDGGRAWTPPGPAPGVCPCGETEVTDHESDLCALCLSVVLAARERGRRWR
jgi:hypothetical protein